MKKTLSMCDFVCCGCESAKETKKFIDDWFKTKGNPCSICGHDKSKCNFYKELVASGRLTEQKISS